MSGCPFPEHHRPAPRSHRPPVGLLLAVLAAAAVLALGVTRAAQFVTSLSVPAAVPVAVLAVLTLAAAVRLGAAAVRFVMLPPAAKRHYPAAVWARLRWRWLARNLALAYVDQHRKSARRVPIPFGTSVKVQNPNRDLDLAVLRFPRARFRADLYGIEARVKTIPKVGRAEFEAAAPHIANAWRCHRVQIAQPKPGRLLVRGLRRDPLAEPFGIEDAPTGVYAGEPDGALSRVGHQVSSDLLSRKGSRPIWDIYLGKTEWGQDAWASLRNITGAVVGGQPGTGKTTLANSVLMQLAPSPAVQLAICDGQGGADFTAWQDRAFLYAGDDPAAAAAVLEDVHALMRQRFAAVLEVTGHRNAWRTGPTEGFPLVLLIVDEGHVYLDLEAVKGLADREKEKHVRMCRAMLGQLVRRGRSVMIFTLIISQKPTSDSVPTFIRDNAGLRLCFGVQTIDAAVSVLGEQIRTYPSLSPVSLTGPENVGVLTAQIRTAGSPYVRLRCPEISEEAADERARLTAPLRRDPRETRDSLAPVLPALDPGPHLPLPR